MEKIVSETLLDWVIPRPVRLTSGPRTGAYRSGSVLPVGLFPEMSRADTAEFMLKQVTDDTYLHGRPTITYQARWPTGSGRGLKSFIQSASRVHGTSIVT